MGSIIKVSCADCGYDKMLYTGGGLRDIDPETALMNLDDENKRLFGSSDARTHPFTMLRKACRCLSCGCIYTDVEVDYIFEGNEKTYRNLCPECGSREKETVDTVKGCICPGCGGNVSFSNAGLWD